MPQENEPSVLVEYRNWYQAFVDELKKQPGTVKCSSVVEAAHIVAESNPYLKERLDFIERSEAIGADTLITLAEIKNKETGEPELLPFMHIDLTTRDYIALYLSLVEPHFATIACIHRGNWSPDVRYQKPALIEAFLAKHLATSADRS
jgi:hypothetical protein